MNIYFSGIGGVAIGPLSEIAKDAGYEVQGSDQKSSLVTERLAKRGIAVSIGEQDGAFLKQCHEKRQIDWFIYSSALPNDHPELTLAQELGIKTAKRDELIAHIIEEKNLKLIAVAGTHGKTTTTAMFVWLFKQLGIPISYSVGTTLSWGPSGFYTSESQYFVYECDEFDRNFLHFHPYLSIITNIDYDHPDTYPSEDDYFKAFDQFIRQSNRCILWQQDFGGAETIKGSKTLIHMIDKDGVKERIDSLRIAGRHNRENAYLILTDCLEGGIEEETAKHILESFPGTDRRFERLADNLYSDYGHHPAEIKATLQMAKELSDNVMLVYQPHQNARQHRVKNEYKDAFLAAEKTYWLPTYLSREDPSLAILTPEELISNITNHDNIEATDLNDALWEHISEARSKGKLVLLMGAGSIDGWAREKLKA